MPSSRSIKALYFPHIEFRDTDWLKSSLLFWEGIKRVVPSGLQPEDSDLVKRLSDAGLVESVDPSRYLDAAKARFLHRASWIAKSRPDIRRQSPHLANDYRLVHVEKLDRKLLRRLVDTGAAKIEGVWAQVRADIAPFYMYSLCSVVSEALWTPMLADSDCDSAAGYCFGSEGAPDPAAADVGFQLARLTIGFPSPESLHKVSARRLIELRGETEELRHNFRSECEALTDGLSNVRDGSTLAEFLAHHARRVDLASERLSAAIAHDAPRNLWGLLDLKAPATLVAAGTLMQTPQPALIVGGLALGAVRWFFKRPATAVLVNEIERMASYLIALEDHGIGGRTTPPTEFDAAMTDLIQD